MISRRNNSANCRVQWLSSERLCGRWSAKATDNRRSLTDHLSSTRVACQPPTAARLCLRTVCEVEGPRKMARRTFEDVECGCRAALEAAEASLDAVTGASER